MAYSWKLDWDLLQPKMFYFYLNCFFIFPQLYNNASDTFDTLFEPLVDDLYRISSQTKIRP